MSTSYIIIFLLCRAMHCTRKNDELHLRMTTSYRLLFCEVFITFQPFFYTYLGTARDRIQRETGLITCLQRILDHTFQKHGVNDLFCRPGGTQR